MTPPTTATARSTNRSASGSRRAAARHPRRISGPAGPARSAAAAAVAIPAPGIALPRRRPARRAAGRNGQGAPGLALRAVDAFEGISSSAVLDRLIRGRVWIGLVAFALIGIVAMQLLVLELNTGIGRTLGQVAQLQRQNAQLGIEDSTYSAESRVAPLAVAAGMTLAPAGTVHFVAASKADVAHAAAALSTSAQSSASGASGSTEASSGESGSTGTGGGEAISGSGSSPPSSASTAATTGSSEAHPSEGAATTSESSSTASSGQESSASGASSSAAASTPASTPATTAPPGAGAQATGASVAPTSGSGASSGEAGGSGGGSQAGSRE